MGRLPFKMVRIAERNQEGIDERHALKHANSSGSEGESEESDSERGDSDEESEGPPDLSPGSEDSDAEEPPAKKGKSQAGAKPSGGTFAVLVWCSAPQERCQQLHALPFC